ncbi:MAG: hypothetical protein U1A77_01630 [Pirellulales bacterium]
MTFDPYHQWLGIPPREQPPNHYRLLGIDLFESNGDVIAYAADRQMTHLRKFQSSRYVAESQRLLNEVAAARVCLLDPNRRLAYDAELRVRLGGGLPTAGFAPTPTPSAAPTPDFSPAFTPAPAGEASYLPPSTLPPSTLPPSTLPTSMLPPVAMPTSMGPPVMNPAGAAPTIANRPRLVAQPGVAPASAETAGSVNSSTTAAPAVSSTKPLVTTSSTRKKRKRSAGGELLKVIAGGIVGGVIALAVLYFGFHLDPLDLSGKFGVPSPEAAQQTAANTTASPTVGAAGTAGDSQTAGSEADSQSAGDSSAAPLAASPQGPGSTSPSAAAQAANAKTKSDSVDKGASQSTPAAPVRPRVAVPSAEEQAKSKALLQELYKLDAMRSRGEKFELIEQLLKQADEETASDVERFVLLRHSAEIASEIGDAASVMQALRRMAAHFEFDVGVAVERLLVRTAENVRTEVGMDELIPISQAAVIDLIAVNRVDLAMRLTDATYAACLKPQGKGHRKFVFDGQVALKRLHALWLEFEAARMAIESGEATAERRLVYGRFLGLQMGEWEIAIPLLAECDEVEVRLAAQRDLTRPTDVEGRVAVGDMWYELSQRGPSDSAFADRAVYWYQLASGMATGLVKTKVNTRIEECRQRLQEHDEREMSAAGIRRRQNSSPEPSSSSR